MALDLRIFDCVDPAGDHKNKAEYKADDSNNRKAVSIPVPATRVAAVEVRKRENAFVADIERGYGDADGADHKDAEAAEHDEEDAAGIAELPGLDRHGDWGHDECAAADVHVSRKQGAHIKGSRDAIQDGGHKDLGGNDAQGCKKDAGTGAWAVVVKVLDLCEEGDGIPRMGSRGVESKGVAGGTGDDDSYQASEDNDDGCADELGEQRGVFCFSKTGPVGLAQRAARPSAYDAGDSL